MEKQVILNEKQFELTLNRLCYQLIENHNGFEDTVLIGLQPRGIHVLNRLKIKLEEILGHKVVCGQLDITFYRDDFRRREKPIIPSVTNIDFIVENKRVVLIDDVLFSGRTIRAALDALNEIGRPRAVQLAVLVDRGHRELPIRADYVGKNLPTSIDERVSVKLIEVDGDDCVTIGGGQ